MLDKFPVEKFHSEFYGINLWEFDRTLISTISVKDELQENELRTNGYEEDWLNITEHIIVLK